MNIVIAAIYATIQLEHMFPQGLHPVGELPLKIFLCGPRLAGTKLGALPSRLAATMHQWLPFAPRFDFTRGSFAVLAPPDRFAFSRLEPRRFY